MGCSPATEVFLPGNKESQAFCSASYIFTNYLTVHVPILFLNNFAAIVCSYFPDFAISLFKHGNPKVDLAISGWYPSTKNLTI